MSWKITIDSDRCPSKLGQTYTYSIDGGEPKTVYGCGYECTEATCPMKPYHLGSTFDSLEEEGLT